MGWLVSGPVGQLEVGRERMRGAPERGPVASCPRGPEDRWEPAPVPAGRSASECYPCQRQRVGTPDKGRCAGEGNAVYDRPCPRKRGPVRPAGRSHAAYGGPRKAREGPARGRGEGNASHRIETALGSAPRCRSGHTRPAAMAGRSRPRSGRRVLAGLHRGTESRRRTERRRVAGSASGAQSPRTAGVTAGEDGPDRALLEALGGDEQRLRRSAPAERPGGEAWSQPDP